MSKQTKQPDEIEAWIQQVAYAHSDSKSTKDQYRNVMKKYSDSKGMSAEQIIQDYEKNEKLNISERTIKRKHSKKIQLFIIKLKNEGLLPASIKTMVGAIMSFYKYNDLSLGHISQPQTGITYHNKDITKEEINAILAITPIREKAFMAIMAQSGLRPHTVKQLKIENLEKILEPNTPIPCKIDVSREIEKGKFGEGHPTFIAEEAIKYTKQYLSTRTKLKPENLLFTTQHEKQISTKNISRTFRKKAEELQNTGEIDYKIRKGKPSELRLYNLRKFFRKFANQMGFEHVNYLMNHTTKGSDHNYTPENPEWYRELYREKAMPFLTLETPTPTETKKIVETLQKQHKTEMETLKQEYDGKFKKLETERVEVQELKDRLIEIENQLLPSWELLKEMIAKTKEEQSKEKTSQA